MAEGIVTDITRIHSSIFDHKPQLRTEIELFVKEFEEKRKETEVDHLFRVLERVTELKDTEIPRTSSLADIHLPKLLGELQVSESISEKLIYKLQASEPKYKEKLEASREERTKEWDSFVHDMTTKCIKIDSIYKDKGEEVKKLYLKAEEPFIRKSS